MGLFNMDAVEVQESQGIKIGVDTGAGKTAWAQSATYRQRIPGLVRHFTASAMSTLS